jgi:hypothetical protein
MGGKNKSEIKTQITNELSVEINNKTTNINRVTNTATNELTQSIKNNAEASVNVNTSGINETDIDEIIIDASGTANIEQNMKLAAVTNALISILTDASQKQTNINDLTDKIKNQINNDQNLKQDVEFLAKIGQYSTNNGGPEAVAEALAGVVDSFIKTVGGTSNSNVTETDVRNHIKTTINNEVINENELNNKISTSIKNSMEQLGSGVCKVDTTGVNTLRSRRLLIGEDGTFNFKQILDISSFTSCIIKLQLAANLASDLTNKFIVDTGSLSENTQSTDTKGKISGEIEQKDDKTSSIMKSIDNLVNNVSDLAGSWVYIIGGVVGLIILIIAAVIFIPMMSSSKKDDNSDDDVADSNNDSNDDSNDYDNSDNITDNKQKGGGINGTIYLLASFIAIFILIANKSLPLCGALLIVIILYLVNKKKPELLSLQN